MYDGVGGGGVSSPGRGEIDLVGEFELDVSFGREVDEFFFFFFFFVDGSIRLSEQMAHSRGL